MMQDSDLKNSKSKDKGSRSRSQSMNDQSHYKQDKTKTRQSINVKSHIFNVSGDNDKTKQSPTRMSSVFAMTDLGSLNYFLSISVTRDSLGMFLSQKKYAVEILDRAHMVNCNPSWTPIDTESKLGSDGDPVSDPTLYQSLATSLQYLTFTRPDISYAVQQLFSSSTTDLFACSDADWAGCPTTRRSTFGYCVFLGNNLLSWSSKRQPTLSRSSAEAECHDVANVVVETCWLRNLLRELHTPLSSATLVYCDNVSAVYLSCNPVQHQRTKHIEIDIHFVRDLVAVGQVRVPHVPSRYQFADIFTKRLPSALFEEFRSSLSTTSKKLAEKKVAKFEKNITKRGLGPMASKKIKTELYVLAFFTVVVVGSCSPWKHEQKVVAVVTDKNIEEGERDECGENTKVRL
ncbi:ribonuclease H-like domain-containing protein, partial [Tanacetum coccineum]